MAVSPNAGQFITGRVASVNPKGLKLDGHAEWLNFSKFWTQYDSGHACLDGC